MINQLPDPILENILHHAEQPHAFLTNHSCMDLCITVMKRLVTDNAQWVAKIDNPTLALAICQTTNINDMDSFHPSCRHDKQIGMFILDRSEGFQYEKFGIELYNDPDIIQRAIELTNGYIYGLLPIDVQKSENIIRLTATYMGCEPNSSLDSMVDDVNAIIQNSWEDLW